MKTYQQVREIIEHARDFHQRLSVFFDQLTDDTGRERIRMLLTYLGRHEQYLGKALERYEKEAAEHILDLWFQHVPEKQDLSDIDDRFEVKPVMSVDEVVRSAMQLDNYIIHLYEGIASKADDPEVREVFQNILEMEKEEQRRISKNANAIKNI